MIWEFSQLYQPLWAKTCQRAEHSHPGVYNTPNNTQTTMNLIQVIKITEMNSYTEMHKYDTPQQETWTINVKRDDRECWETKQAQSTWTFNLLSNTKVVSVILLADWLNGRFLRKELHLGGHRQILLNQEHLQQIWTNNGKQQWQCTDIQQRTKAGTEQRSMYYILHHNGFWEQNTELDLDSNGSQNPLFTLIVMGRELAVVRLPRQRLQEFCEILLKVDLVNGVIEGIWIFLLFILRVKVIT